MAQRPGKKNKLYSRKKLTFGRAIDDLVLLLGVLENTLGTEHLLVVRTVEFDLLLWMLLAILDH